ncbi:MAG: fluoride efflux transporter CrcB [Betaproteobacteria bacterium]
MITRDGPLLGVLAAIALGAVLGAWLRWGLSYWLNERGALPLGTLAANLIGAYVIGLAVVVFALQPGLSPLWRLFLVTGLLGALTTFSTFSAESIAMLSNGQWGLALTHTALHLVGSLAATAAGIATVRALN